MTDPGEEDTWDQLVQIRDAVVNDPAAISEWPRVVDKIVKSAADRHRIKRLISQEQQYAEAVLQSLCLWHGYQAQRADLVQVLRTLGLNALVEKISKHDILLTSSRSSASWFGVGHMQQNFTGRASELARTHILLTEARTTGSPKANVVCICGLGGIGKTSLARKYAFEYAQYYEGNVIWINGGTFDAMRSSFLQLANQLQFRVTEHTYVEKLVPMVYEHFRKSKYLFIFDNVSEKADLLTFVPEIINSRFQTPYVLATSRRRDLILVKNTLIPDCLTIHEAVQLINTRLTQPSEIDGQRLVRKFQGLPLALQQATAYIAKKYGNTEECISYCLDELENSENILRALLNDLNFMNEGDEYQLTTRTTWDSTLAIIGEQDDKPHDANEHSPTTSETLTRAMEPNRGFAAIKLIKILSFLDPEETTRQFLQMIFGEKTEPSLRQLEYFSMTRSSGSKIQIHRLVQLVIRLGLDYADDTDALNVIMKAVMTVVRQENSTLRAECIAHFYHLLPFVCIYPALVKKHFDSTQLNAFCFIPSPSQELLAHARVCETFESVLGELHVCTLLVKFWTSDGLTKRKLHSSALDVLLPILPTAKSVLGNNHWLTRRIIRLMRSNYLRMGEFGKAYDLFVGDKLLSVVLWFLTRSVG